MLVKKNSDHDKLYINVLQKKLLESWYFLLDTVVCRVMNSEDCYRSLTTITFVVRYKFMAEK